MWLAPEGAELDAPSLLMSFAYADRLWSPEDEKRYHNTNRWMQTMDASFWQCNVRQLTTSGGVTRKLFDTLLSSSSAHAQGMGPRGPTWMARSPQRSYVFANSPSGYGYKIGAILEVLMQYDDMLCRNEWARLTVVRQLFSFVADTSATALADLMSKPSDSLTKNEQQVLPTARHVLSQSLAMLRHVVRLIGENSDVSDHIIHNRWHQDAAEL